MLDDQTVRSLLQAYHDQTTGEEGVPTPLMILHGLATTLLMGSILTSDGPIQWVLRTRPLVFVGNEGFQLPLPREITCDSLQSQLQLKAGQLHIASFNCRGDDLAIQVRGNVQWQQPLTNSLLDLNIQMRSETT